MKHSKLTKAFSLIELSVVVLLIGLVTIVAVNGKSLLVKANCVASSFGTKTVTDNLDNPTDLTTNKSTAYENCVNAGGPSYVVSIPTVNCSGATCTSCKTLLEANPGIASGTYTIDPDGDGTGLSPFNAYCDMTTDSGGWTLVLNYLHKAGTNPALVVKTNSLPLINSTSLININDESASPTSWGHAGNALLNKFTFTELRFYGKTSGHDRIINFKTSLNGCVTYFKTAIGTCTGLNNSFTPFNGHNSYIPGVANEYYNVKGDWVMTAYNFSKSPYYWSVKGWPSYIYPNDNRWEVDDHCVSSCDTYHQVWIR